MTQAFYTAETQSNARILVQAGQTERSIRRSRRANRTSHRSRIV